MTPEESAEAARVASTLTDTYWVTQDGQRFLPQDMTDGHLLNTLRILLEGRMIRKMCSNLTQAEWCDIFERELQRRHPKFKIRR